MIDAMFLHSRPSTVSFVFIVLQINQIMWFKNVYKTSGIICLTKW